MTEQTTPDSQPIVPSNVDDKVEIPDGDIIIGDEEHQLKLIHTPEAEKNYGVIVRKLNDQRGLETEVHPWAEVEELPDASGRGRFALRLFNKAKEVVHDAEEVVQEHPKAATFTAAGVIVGVATSIVFLKKKS